MKLPIKTVVIFVSQFSADKVTTQNENVNFVSCPIDSPNEERIRYERSFIPKSPGAKEDEDYFLDVIWVSAALSYVVQNFPTPVRFPTWKKKFSYSIKEVRGK